jgi:probable rRNA maturation factor
MSDDGEQPTILISDRQDIPVDRAEIVELASACLRGEGVARSELSISFVTTAEMSDLHLRYMNEAGPTDVLSFPMDERDGDVQILGDVVISPEVASRNNPDLPAELRLLLVHVGVRP